MSFGIFEASVSSDEEAKLAKQASVDKMAAAIYDCREQLGPSLFASRDIQEFRHKIAMMKNDQSIYKIVGAHLDPVAGIMRQIAGKKGALEKEFLAILATGIHAADGPTVGPMEEPSTLTKGQRDGVADGDYTKIQDSVQTNTGDGSGASGQKVPGRPGHVGGLEDAKELKPKGDFAAYLKKVDQCSNKVERNFTSAAQITAAQLYFDWAESKGANPRKKATLQAYANGNRSLFEHVARGIQAWDFSHNPKPPTGQSKSKLKDVTASGFGKAWADSERRRHDDSENYAADQRRQKWMDESGAGDVASGQGFGEGAPVEHPKSWQNDPKTHSYASRRQDVTAYLGEHSNFPEDVADRGYRVDEHGSPINAPAPDGAGRQLGDNSNFPDDVAERGYRVDGNGRRDANRRQSTGEPVWPGSGQGATSNPEEPGGTMNQGPSGPSGYIPGTGSSPSNPLGGTGQFNWSSKRDPMKHYIAWCNENGYKRLSARNIEFYSQGNPKLAYHLAWRARNAVRVAYQRLATSWAPPGFQERDESGLDAMESKPGGGGSSFSAQSPMDANATGVISTGSQHQALGEHYPPVNTNPHDQAYYDEHHLVNPDKMWNNFNELNVHGQPGMHGEKQHLQGRRRSGATDYLTKANDALTQLLNQKAEEFQETIAPLQQALVTVQQATQLQQAQNPMNVLPPPGTVNVLPGGDQGPAGMPAPGAQDLGAAAQALAGPLGGGGALGGAPPPGDAPGGGDPSAQAGPPPAAAGGGLPPGLDPSAQKAAKRGGRKKAQGANRPRRLQADELTGTDPYAYGPASEREHLNSGPSPQELNPLPGFSPNGRARNGPSDGQTSAAGEAIDGAFGTGGSSATGIGRQTEGAWREAASVTDLWNKWSQGTTGVGGDADYDNFANTYKVGPRALQKLKQTHQQQGVGPVNPNNPGILGAADKGNNIAEDASKAQWETQNSHMGQLGYKFDKGLNQWTKPGQKSVKNHWPHTSSRHTAWTGWGPQQFPKARKVAGWDWDDYQNGYTASAPRHFECACGEPFPAPSGFHRCACGKQWNSFVIGTGGNNHEASAEKFFVREIPTRPDVIMASRQMNAGDSPSWHDTVGNGSWEFEQDEHGLRPKRQLTHPMTTPEDDPHNWWNRPEYKQGTQLMDREGNIHTLVDPGEIDPDGGESAGHSTFKQQPNDWARRGDGAKWQKSPIGR